MDITVARHCVANDPVTGLSPLQRQLLDAPQKIRIANAPTGAGKSYVFQRAMIEGKRILFVVPTRRLAQNLMAGLLDDLIRDGWDEEKAKKKLALWNSDETKRLQELGETNIGARRVREVCGLNTGIEGGEMIVAVPEVVSNLLLRYRMEKGQTDIGVFEMLNQFEHIVFDEFHTISPRGFGLAGVLAKLAAEYPCRAQISFLSATPLNLDPVFERLGISGENIVRLDESLTAEGRAVHGDVRLCFRKCESMVELAREQIENIRGEVARGRQVVMIYNALADLQRHLPFLQIELEKAGVRPGRTLLINSIDDSRSGAGEEPFFVSGRRHRPEDFDILIATASVEMGVTFRTDFLIMEPGFEPMNFLQRYGRAARGDRDGCVLVRYDDKTSNKNPWFSYLEKWMDKHSGQTVDITELTGVLSREAQRRFRDCPEDGEKHFGKLPNRAAFTTGLYWNVLMGHFSNQGHRWKHLKEHRPKPAATIYGLLKEIRKMETDRQIGNHIKDWCDRFEREARTLRDIGRGIRVMENDGNTFYAREFWLRRETDIPNRFPLIIADDGVEEIRIDGKLKDYLLDEKNFVEATRNVLFPHTGNIKIIPDDVFLITNWQREFEKRTGSASFAWEIWPESMKAASTLVGLTGLAVSDDSLELEPVNLVL